MIILSKGQIVAYGEPNNVITADLIRDVYGVVVEVYRNNGDILIIPKTTVKSES